MMSSWTGCIKHPWRRSKWSCGPERFGCWPAFRQIRGLKHMKSRASGNLQRLERIKAGNLRAPYRCRQCFAELQ
eukprot:4083827-Prymnesium_polylepis.1